MSHAVHLSGRPRNGLATAIALLLLALVAVALVVIAQLVRDDARRTFDERVNAQLRALVLAAVIDARTHLQEDGRLIADTAVPMPPAMEPASVRYTAAQQETQWLVQILARCDDRELQSECTLEQNAGVWTVRDSKLLPR